MCLSMSSGLERFREAALALEEGLRMDPFHPALKEQLDIATQGVVADLLQGKTLSSWHILLQRRK